MYAQITFDRQNYIGSFQIIDRETWEASPVYNVPEPTAPLQLQIGRRYILFISHGAGVEFTVQVNDKGTATIVPFEPERAAGITCVGTTITFNTAEVWIDAPQYRGPYTVTNVPPHKANRFRVLKGIEKSEPDAGYILEFAPPCAIRFNVDANGIVALNDHYSGAAIINAPQN